MKKLLLCFTTLGLMFSGANAEGMKDEGSMGMSGGMSDGLKAEVNYSNESRGDYKNSRFGVIGSVYKVGPGVVKVGYEQGTMKYGNSLGKKHEVAGKVISAGYGVNNSDFKASGRVGYVMSELMFNGKKQKLKGTAIMFEGGPKFMQSGFVIMPKVKYESVKHKEKGFVKKLSGSTFDIGASVDYMVAPQVNVGGYVGRRTIKVDSDYGSHTVLRNSVPVKFDKSKSVNVFSPYVEFMVNKQAKVKAAYEQYKLDGETSKTFLVSAGYSF